MVNALPDASPDETFGERPLDIDTVTTQETPSDPTVVHLPDDALYEAGVLAMRPIELAGEAIRRRKDHQGEEASHRASIPVAPRVDTRIPQAVGLVAVAVGAAGGFLLTGDDGYSQKMLQIGVLRMGWALAVLWLALRIIPARLEDRSQLLATVALTLVPFAASFTPVAGTIITVLWAVIVTLALRRTYDAPWRCIGLFLAASIGLSMAAVLMRWAVQWIWLVVAVQRGVA